MHGMKELGMFVKLQDIRWWHYYKTEGFYFIQVLAPSSECRQTTSWNSRKLREEEIIFKSSRVLQPLLNLYQSRWHTIQIAPDVFLDFLMKVLGISLLQMLEKFCLRTNILFSCCMFFHCEFSTEYSKILWKTFIPNGRKSDKFLKQKRQAGQ